MSISVTTRRMSAPVLTSRRSPQCACLLLLVCTFACLLIGCSGSGDCMRQQLQQLQARNQSDSLMTDDSLATALCTWFDSHGTPNERMLAHYLMGRTWADKGEAPQALEEYHTAAECADTTAADCDFRLLSRIYGQSANIFNQQGLYRDQLNYTNLAVKYAWNGKDTLSALLCFAQKGVIYSQLQLKDSAIFIYEKAISQLRRNKLGNIAAKFAGVLAQTYIEKGETKRAEAYLIEHEKESGYFNDCGDIEKGREVYYYFKGLYYLKNKQYDSAEYYFRKELSLGKDFNNQNYGSLGLAQLFQQTNKADSSAKYYAYSYAMNDSCFVQMTTQEVEQAQGMYDYSRQQEKALQEQLKSEKRQRIIWFLIISAVSILIFTFSRLFKKKKEQKKLIEKLISMQAEVMQLREHKASYELLIKEKEKQVETLGDTLYEMKVLKKEKERFDQLLRIKEDKIEQQKAEIKKYKRLARQEKEVIKHQLDDAPIYKLLSEKAIKGKEITDREWTDVERFVADRLPEFYMFVSSRNYALTTIMYHVSILVRLQFSFISISHMMGVKAPTITKVCSVVLKKLFNKEGSGKDLEQELIQFN